MGARMTLSIDDFKERIKKIAQKRAESLENYIALYLHETGFSIEDITLVEKRSEDGLRIEWYCERKDKVQL